MSTYCTWLRNACPLWKKRNATLRVTFLTNFFFEHIPWQKLSYEILSKNRRKSNKLSPSWSNVGFLFFAVFFQCTQFLLALGVTIPRQSAQSGVWELFSGWGWFGTFNFFFSQDTLSRGLPTTGWSDLGECRNWQPRQTGFAFASASQWPLPWAMLASSLMVFRFVALWQNWPQSLCCSPPLGTTLHRSPSPLQHLSGWHSAAFLFSFASYSMASSHGDCELDDEDTLARFRAEVQFWALQFQVGKRAFGEGLLTFPNLGLCPVGLI